jgi:hypothetical protein
MRNLTTREARLGILLTALIAAAGCTLQGSASTASGGSIASADRARRGEYLVRATGCNDCYHQADAYLVAASARLAAPPARVYSVIADCEEL